MNVKVELEEDKESLPFPKLMISDIGNLGLFSEYGRCVYIVCRIIPNAGLRIDHVNMENFADFHGSIEITQ